MNQTARHPHRGNCAAASLRRGNAEPLHVLFVADDLLSPTNSGGRRVLVDELSMLLRAGVRVTLFGFAREDDLSTLQFLQGLNVEHRYRRRSGMLRAAFSSPRLPNQMSSRRWTSDDLEWVAERSPYSAVIGHHEWTLPFAKAAARAAGGVPVILRSHNDERLFLEDFAREATGARKLYTYLEALRLTRSVMRRTLSGVSEVWTIAETDNDVYERYGVRVRALTPPLVHHVAAVRKPPKKAVIAFVGALDLPHAVSGLEWFVSKCMPVILANVPSASLIIAGRRASTGLAAWLRSQPGVEFAGEVQSAEDFLTSARVFVNPAVGGSGVNMKMGLPISVGLPVVSTLFGVRGLSVLSSAIPVAENPSDFASSVVELCVNDDRWLEVVAGQNQAAEQLTHLAASDAMCSVLADVVDRSKEVLRCP